MLLKPNQLLLLSLPQLEQFLLQLLFLLQSQILTHLPLLKLKMWPNLVRYLRTLLLLKGLQGQKLLSKIFRIWKIVMNLPSNWFSKVTMLKVNQYIIFIKRAVLVRLSILNNSHKSQMSSILPWIKVVLRVALLL